LKIAREGLPFVIAGAAISAALWFFARTSGSLPLTLLAVVVTILAAWVFWFFRDPERVTPTGADFVISPADGKLVAITEVDEPGFMNGRAIRLSIFMNVLNVHVNRYPIDGRVAYVHYNHGKFLHAASEKASLDNEQMSVGIVGQSGKVLVRQIAGIIARRIVNYSRENQSVERGARMGLIRFGSRVDVFMPPGSELRIQIGEHTTAGTTVLGVLRG
jgi:phosphatidylserine decarboxylase